MEILMKNYSSGSKFATGNMNFIDSEKVYGSIDTPSLTPFDPPLAPSFAPPEATRNKENRTSRTIIIIVVPTVVLLAFVIGSISCGMLYMKKAKLNRFGSTLSDVFMWTNLEA
ncbi:hypothetical protein J1N35_037380 [Gossypium stocksii]|uniref:Malectin-like domain-containing protein n=1 Tax=Gossypium stocksii TaxID=47602 RepID=A0A9D3UJK3_9ROSI|nr:hypothetical protein J1N35_037380 [Gossypium stocksii]